MRIKVTPKEALLILDKIIENGFQVYLDIMKEKMSNDPREFALHNWNAKTQEQLKRIFLDFTPIYKVIKDIETLIKLANSSPQKRQRTLRENNSLLVKALDLLSDYYDIIEKEAYSPLFYIPERSQICLHSWVIQLTPDTFEDALCKQLFNFSFNEYIPKDKLAALIWQMDEDDYNAEWGKKINSAIEGINIKASETFKFQIIKKTKTVVALTLPSRFLPEERIKMASIRG